MKKTHPIIERVHMFLQTANDGNADMSDELIENFGERMKEIMRSHFKPKTDEGKKREKNVIRMSQVGRPLCQLQMEVAHTNDPENGPQPSNDDPWLRMKFLYGDVLEAVAMAILHSCYKVESEQEELGLDIADIHLKGHMDVQVDGKIWDIKTASPFSFSKVYGDPKGFDALVKDDPFGYIPQGYLYGAAAGRPFGGWIGINKSSGEWGVLETPEVDYHFQNDAINQAEDNIRALTSNKPFERCFEPENEMYYNKPTGEKVLAKTCQYCKWVESCWGDKAEYRANAKSKAANPPKKWYVA
jgi:hypothetical protein